MRILMLSSGTGGGEMFHELNKYLKTEKGIEITNISLTDTAKKVNADSELVKDINNRKGLRPDIVIYETSNDCEHRDQVLLTFKGHVPIVSIMDVFDNTNKRFSKIIPDFICTPTESIATEMRDYGYKNVWTYTNPAFINLEKLKINSKVRKDIIKILYVAQGKENKHYMDHCLEIIEKCDCDYDLHIKPHPEKSLDDDNLLKYYPKVTECKGKHKHKSVKFLDVNPFKSIEELILDYDLIVGLHSTIQIKSYILGIPTIFYEYNLNKLEDAVYQIPFDIQYKYHDFIECASLDNFKYKTDKLIEIMRKIIMEY